MVSQNFNPDSQVLAIFLTHYDKSKSELWFVLKFGTWNLEFARTCGEQHQHSIIFWINRKNINQFHM